MLHILCSNVHYENCLPQAQSKVHTIETASQLSAEAVSSHIQATF